MGLCALICEKKWGNLDFSLFKMLHYFKTFFIKVKSLIKISFFQRFRKWGRSTNTFKLFSTGFFLKERGRIHLVLSS